MITFVIILGILLSSCANKNLNHPKDLLNEVGTWVSVSDTFYTAPYYLIEDSIYVGYITLEESPRDFFLSCKYNYPDLAQPLTDVDVASFEVNINSDNEPYAKDKRYVYYPLPNYDSPIFIDGYRGGGEIYCGDISIKGADPLSFQYIGNGYAIDRNYMYYRGESIEWNDSIITALQQSDGSDIITYDYGTSKDK